MYDWPRFAAHLSGAEPPPAERMLSLLSDVAASGPTPRAQDVLAALFEDTALIDEVARLAPRMHHVGLVAPAGLDVAAIKQLLEESPFGDQIRQFESVVLAKDLSAQLGRTVKVTVVQGNAAPQSPGCPAVEIFVADLPPKTLRDLVEREAGCHVALGLDAGDSLERVCGVLHAHGCWEIPLMRHGALLNPELRSSVLYIDVPGFVPNRRLEFIAPCPA